MASGVLISTARGVQVRLVCATCGEEGDIRQPGGRYPRDLRTGTARGTATAPCAVGLRTHYVRYRDSGWGTRRLISSSRLCPGATWQVVQRLVGEIRRFKPHIVLTFRPMAFRGIRIIRLFRVIRLPQCIWPAIPLPSQSRPRPMLFRTSLRLFYVARLQGTVATALPCSEQAGLDVPCLTQTAPAKGYHANRCMCGSTSLPIWSRYSPVCAATARK